MHSYENGLFGITYSPYNNDGSCPDPGKVSSDLKTISGLAKSIRLYATDCSQLESSIKAVESGIDISIYAGIWISNGDDRFQKELEEFVGAVKPLSNRDFIKGVSVGNEELHKNTMDEGKLIGYINSVRERLKSEGIDIPVYTTDTDAKFTANLANSCDEVQVNIYAVFDQTFSSVNDSVNSVFSRLDSVKSKIAIDSQKPIRIGETGWADKGSESSAPTTQEIEQQYFDTFVCQANENNIEYFYFEAKDATWKAGASPLEKSFGVFKDDFSQKLNLDKVLQC
ncbi:hypothetical protein H4219_001963 [Mycoemilia scoparia]|uniref:glucan endo-1,3-beta-D-glucosidase n=1 Tax=Mycoemilia scoparia TaxID=417184 RepID=A0A9W7ZYR5_9FUNG|nr:hypothetical protein H4219_001963 [Mycoemilia scoparia]